MKKLLWCFILPFIILLSSCGPMISKFEIETQKGITEPIKILREDYDNMIKENENEIKKLNKKLDALIEMRTDGDISKDVFRLKSDEITKRIAKLKEEIISLTPTPEEKSDDNFSERLDSLKEKLKKYIHYGNEDVVPDELIEAFFQKIVVSKDEFKWYLRSDTKILKDEKKLISLPNDKIENLDECRMIASFTMDIEQAKKYMYEFSTKHRVHRWKDIKVTIWL